MSSHRENPPKVFRELKELFYNDSKLYNWENQTRFFKVSIENRWGCDLEEKPNPSEPMRVYKWNKLCRITFFFSLLIHCTQYVTSIAAYHVLYLQWFYIAAYFICSDLKGSLLYFKNWRLGIWLPFHCVVSLTWHTIYRFIINIIL